jgi:integrase
MTWADYQKRYLEFKETQGKAKRTLDRYRASLDAFGRFLKKQEVCDVHSITLLVLEGYNEYRTKKEKCDSKTAYNDALTIKNALKWGSRASRGLLRSNPSADWETPKPIKPKRRCYTTEEVALMETGVREWLRPVIVTLAFTGLRIGELIHLRWVDVDLEKRVLHIRVQEEWKPKGRRDRWVPLHPKVEAAIRGQPVGVNVFMGPNGGRLKENFTLYCLKKDQVKLKMPLGDLHAFRRFFATTMMKAGVNVESVRQWGGWKSLDTMLRYLADVDVKESVEAMDQAAKRLATA